MRAKKSIAAFMALVMIFLTGSAVAQEKKALPPPDIGEIRVIRASDLGQKEWTFEDYRIDTGDVLDISVWQVEELHKSVVVRPDGKISFPLIGDVAAAGHTIDEVVKNITDKLKKYIKTPQVSIIVSSFGGKKIIVLGEVGSDGIIRFTEPVKILEVLALAGGYLESACIKNILIIRGDLKNSADIIVVNVADILKGNLSENIYIEKNDIIFVPRSFIGNVAYFIRQVAPLLGAAATYYNIKSQYFQFKNKTYRGGS